MRHAAAGATRAQSLRAQRDQIENQHLVLCQTGQAQQQLQRLERLQAAEYTGHRTQHAGLGAVADDSVTRGFRPHAAQAGRVSVAGDQLQLSLVLVDAGEQHRFAGVQCHIIEQELAAEIVGAVDHQVVTLHEPLGIPGIEPQRVRVDAHFGIQRLYARRGQRRLFAATFGQRVPGLPMQVGGFEPVTVDDTETTHTCAGQVLQHRNTESTGAHHQHRGGPQARLALWPHFAQATWRE
jgi:hypothetical protein